MTTEGREQEQTTDLDSEDELDMIPLTPKERKDARRAWTIIVIVLFTFWYLVMWQIRHRY